MANPRQLDGDRHSNRKARQYVARAGALVSQRLEEGEAQWP